MSLKETVQVEKNEQVKHELAFRFGHEVAIGAHFYDPYRKLFIDVLQKVQTSPDGIDWTQRAIDWCYKPLAEVGVFNQIYFDIAPNLLAEIEKRDPQTYKIIIEAMKEQGIGMPAVHAILPDMSESDIEILIEAGYKDFENRTGVKPKIIWFPEAGVNKKVLEIAYKVGYRGFVCAEHQILVDQKDRGKPAVIELKNNRQMIAFPIDKERSTTELAFLSPERRNADTFSYHLKYYLEHLNSDYPPIIFSDGEQYGLHWSYGVDFIKRLLEASLSRDGISQVSLNQLIANLDINKLPKAILVENTSWSCPAGLNRWHDGKCYQNCGCREDKNVDWKAPYDRFFDQFNQEVSQKIKQIFEMYGIDFEKELIRNFSLASKNDGDNSDVILNLISAKVSSFIARTSCATFFADINTSGRINIAFALQAILFFEKAGFSGEAYLLYKKLLKGLYEIKLGKRFNRCEVEEDITAQDHLFEMLSQGEAIDKILPKFIGIL